MSKSFVVVVSLTGGITRIGIPYMCEILLFLVEISLTFVSSQEHCACFRLEGTD